MPNLSKTRNGNKSLIAVVGLSCAAWLCAEVPRFEGIVLRGYRDPVGIVTACAGHTKTAVLGLPYSPQECAELLQADLIEHADGVLICSPHLTGGPLAAAVSFTFNVGAAKYCGSTMARLFNQGRIAEGCAELSRWIYAKGKVLNGLVKRRAAERAICEGGL